MAYIYIHRQDRNTKISMIEEEIARSVEYIYNIEIDER